MYEIIDSYKDINDIKNMSEEEIKNFSDEIRKFLINKVSNTGGHLSSNLGVVELTLALYKVFDFNNDKIIWDVGHQAYVHKILTGRAKNFDTLRKYQGMSGFPKKNESKYDFFETGHSSTSISAAVGMARSRDIKKEKHEVIAVIGDGALTGGMAFEALNDIGFNKSKIIVVLNDNGISIAENVGGLSMHLAKLRGDKKYNKLKKEIKSFSRSSIGKTMNKSMKHLKDAIKKILLPSSLFEDMGFKYFGPIDGHNIKELTKILENAKNIDAPVLIHVKTTKGKGYDYAEKNPYKFHGIGPFNLENGEVEDKSGKITYSKVFGDTIIDMAREEKNIVAITAAMPDGCALTNYSKEFPDRFFDVGIAEQHAVTMAAGMASTGIKPYFAVYSTFLQRGYDQVLHDVCIQNLPVVFAIDRSGVVGNDGETHQGIFDLSYLSMIPNITIMSPKCTEELKNMLYYSKNFNGPLAIRYPRGGDVFTEGFKVQKEFTLGKWEIITEGENIAIIAVGKMVQFAHKAVMKLKEEGINITLINAVFVKPLDYNLLDEIKKHYKVVITVEDNVIAGGFGSYVNQYMNSSEISVKNLGYPDEFVPHGDIDTLYKLYKLDSEGIYNKIKEEM